MKCRTATVLHCSCKNELVLYYTNSYFFIINYQYIPLIECDNYTKIYTFIIKNLSGRLEKSELLKYIFVQTYIASFSNRNLRDKHDDLHQISIEAV